jgi:predicted amidophosphoribosyltransferase
VPGHDSKILSFGARLAAAVASALGKPLVPCSSLTDFRPPAKGMDPDDRASMVRNKFACNEHVGGQSLLIVDDVYSSGSTADEAARALHAAGATQVASLCAVRTMKS